MEELSQFKNMLNELQRCRMNVKKQINEFKSLQNEIRDLHEKANKDPDALRKLAKFNDVISHDDGARKLLKKSEEAKLIFSQLSKQFNQLSSESIDKSASFISSEKKKKITKQQYRKFV